MQPLYGRIATPKSERPMNTSKEEITDKQKDGKSDPAISEN